MEPTNEFLSNFNFFAWINSAIILSLSLGVAHWFPWSFHLGQVISRYWVFVCGCISIIASFGLWALGERHLMAWVFFLPIIGFLHWIPWSFSWFYNDRVPPSIAYSLASLPAVTIYSGWAMWAGEYEVLAVLLSFYAVSGLTALILAYLDMNGVQNFNNYNAKH